MQNEINFKMNMKCNILWTPWSDPGMEHLLLEGNEEGYLADGVILRVRNDSPFRFRYQIQCDKNWNVRRVIAELERGKRLSLLTDAKGNWTTAEGASIGILQNSIDVDIAATPFTNTIPIRRLNLKQDQSLEILVAYISVPDLELQIARQRYTCLKPLPHGLYRYEGLSTGFVAELPTDDNGLVLDYPGGWRRIFPDANKN
jgi:uncharacterized protein